MRCASCYAPIDPNKPAGRLMAREVIGYALPRLQGGTNHVLDRRETGRILCPNCTRRVLDGVHLDQEVIPL